MLVDRFGERGFVKNVLVFVPLLAAHRFFEPASILIGLTAFLAFGLCASSVYVVNDLLDLQTDRQHPGKRRRPFAAGRLPLSHGLVVARFERPPGRPGVSALHQQHRQRGTLRQARSAVAALPLTAVLDQSRLDYCASRPDAGRPMVFAATDRTSLVLVAVAGLIAAGAM